MSLNYYMGDHKLDSWKVNSLAVFFRVKHILCVILNMIVPLWLSQTTFLAFKQINVPKSGRGYCQRLSLRRPALFSEGNWRLIPSCLLMLLLSLVYSVIIVVNMKFSLSFATQTKIINQIYQAWWSRGPGKVWGIIQMLEPVDTNSIVSRFIHTLFLNLCHMDGIILLRLC